MKKGKTTRFSPFLYPFSKNSLYRRSETGSGKENNPFPADRGILQLRKHISQTFMQYQVGIIVIGRLIPVDQNQTASPVVVDQSR